jgi:hypothetical protein
MDEWEEGKHRFLEIVRNVSGSVEVVIPTKPTNSMFLISLTKGPNRKFITLSEDDLIDLPHEEGIRTRVAKMLQDVITAL